MRILAIGLVFAAGAHPATALAEGNTSAGKTNGTGARRCPVNLADDDGKKMACPNSDAECWSRCHARAVEVLDAAYQTLGDRTEATVAATKKLEATADRESLVDLGKKVKEEREAAQSAAAASQDVDTAYWSLERALENHAWRYRLQFRLRGAGAVGGVGVYGGGARLDLRRTLYTAHGIYLGYEAASNLGFSETTWMREPSTDTVIRAGYTISYKRLVLGASLPYRLGRGGNTYTLSESVFIAPRIGLEFRLDRDCASGCLAPSIEVFAEPWFSVDGTTPTPVFFGVELALYGRGFGPIRPLPKSSDKR